MNYYDLFQGHLKMEGKTSRAFCAEHGFLPRSFYNHLQASTNYVSYRYDEAILNYLIAKKAVTKAEIVRLRDLIDNKKFLTEAK